MTQSEKIVQSKAKERAYPPLPPVTSSTCFPYDAQSVCIVNRTGDMVIFPAIERIELKEGKVIGKKQPYKPPHTEDVFSV